MKKIILVVLLLGIAGIAGVVRSHTKSGGSAWPLVINGDKQSTGTVREEIRKSFQLDPGARVEVAGINGWVKIETSESKTAEVYVERFGESQEVLDRRKVIVEATANTLTIRAEKVGSNFLTRIFGSAPTEQVTLHLPRQIALVARGINGAVTTGAIDGAVEAHGINGTVDIAQAVGSVELAGINGNISCGLKLLNKDFDIHGINGNIELRLGEGVNAALDAHGMNGQVTSDLPDVEVERNHHGSYSAQIGKGGNAISAGGINGDIRLTRMMADKLGD